jgi:pimeloyl-ACP methyl ester carboxylesterase
MLMLHGFPEFWYAWNHQIPEFAKDHTVVALDLRGYNESDKPKLVEAYQIAPLIQDIVGVIQALGEGRCILMAHDWGGALAWSVANAYPHLVDKLIVLNMPHPARLAEALRTPTQLLRSSYFFLFQLPMLPEWLLSKNDYEQLHDIFTGGVTANPTFTSEELDRYREAAAKPGALTAMLNYYRNVFQPQGLFDQNWTTLPMPTLMIWGEQDTAFGKELTYGTGAYVRNLTVRYIPDGTHWLPQENPQLVHRYVREFLSQSGSDEAQPES